MTCTDLTKFARILMLSLAAIVLLAQPSFAQLIVSTFVDSSIQRFNETTGAPLPPLVPPGGSGLMQPAGMTIGPDNNLYVSSQSTNSVLRFNSTTGAFLGTFATMSANYSPAGLRFG